MTETKGLPEKLRDEAQFLEKLSRDYRLHESDWIRVEHITRRMLAARQALERARQLEEAWRHNSRADTSNNRRGVSELCANKLADALEGAP